MKRTIRETGGVITQLGIDYQNRTSLMIFLEKIIYGKDVKLLMEVVGDAAIKEGDHLDVYQMKQSNWSVYNSTLLNDYLITKERKSIIEDSKCLEKGDEMILVTNKSFPIRGLGHYDISNFGDRIKTTEFEFIYNPFLANDRQEATLKKV